MYFLFNFKYSCDYCHHYYYNYYYYLFIFGFLTVYLPTFSYAHFQQLDLSLILAVNPNYSTATCLRPQPF